MIDIAKAPYKRRYKHTKSRGSETYVTCSFCGKRVPRYKAFPVRKSFSIRDPSVLKQMNRRVIYLSSIKQFACPSCARHRKIARKGKSRKSVRSPST